MCFGNNDWIEVYCNICLNAGPVSRCSDLGSKYFKSRRYNKRNHFIQKHQGEIIKANVAVFYLKNISNRLINIIFFSIN